MFDVLSAFSVGANALDAYNFFRAVYDKFGPGRRKKKETERIFRRGCAWLYGLNGRQINKERGFQLLTDAANLG